MRTVAVLACLILSGLAAAQDALRAGALLRHELVLGASSVRKVVPLPAGEWEVLRVREYDGRRTKPNDYSNPPRMVDVALVQRDGRQIVMLMRVVTLREPTSVTRWTQADPCDRKDTLHRNPYDSAVWERTYLLVDHAPGSSPRLVPPTLRTYANGWRRRASSCRRRAALGREPFPPRLDKDPARRRYVDEFVAWSEDFMKRLLSQDMRSAA